MKNRQVPALPPKLSIVIAHAAEAASVALMLGLVATALLPQSVKAAIDPAEKAPAYVSAWGVKTAQAPGHTDQGGDAVVPPVKRETPAAPQQAAPPPAVEPAPATPPPATPQAQRPEKQSPETKSDAVTAEDRKVRPPPPEFGGIFGTIQEWLARANRDYQGVVIKELSLPPAGRTAEDAIAKKLEETKAEDAARTAAGAKARDEEKKRVAEKLAEAKRLAEEEQQRKKAEAATAKPEPAPKSDEAAKIAEELRRTELQQQEDAKRVEAQKKAVEARRLEDEHQRAEARVAEERRRAEEAERAKNRSRTIVLSVEPIRRPEAVGTYYRPELASPAARMRMAEGSSDDGEVMISGSRRHVRLYRAGGAYRGTAVRRWILRADGRQCRNAGRAITPPARYTVKHGDNLWRISERHYNNGRLYPKIYRANRTIISDPDLIYPCQRVLVPRRRNS